MASDKVGRYSGFKKDKFHSIKLKASSCSKSGKAKALKLALILRYSGNKALTFSAGRPESSFFKCWLACQAAATSFCFNSKSACFFISAKVADSSNVWPENEVIEGISIAIIITQITKRGQVENPLTFFTNVQILVCHPEALKDALQPNGRGKHSSLVRRDG